jgi:hypothetical protein
MAVVGRLFFGGTIAISGVVLVASFLRVRTALLLTVVAVVIIPAIFIVPMDTLILTGAWWTRCVMFPVQLGIPAIWGYYLWKADRVRNYYRVDRDDVARH